MIKKVTSATVLLILHISRKTKGDKGTGRIYKYLFRHEDSKQHYIWVSIHMGTFDMGIECATVKKTVVGEF